MTKIKISAKKNAPSSKSISKKMIGKFCWIVSTIVASFLLVASVGLFALAYFGDSDVSASETRPTAAPIKPTPTPETSTIFAPPRKTNFLIMGIDKDASLSDVNIVASLDAETKSLSLIWIPRDTRFVLSNAIETQFNEDGIYPPDVMKFNAIHSYAGKELAPKYMSLGVEQLLGVKVDYFAEVNIHAFRSIIDAVGGIDIVVPEGGMFYNDPAQGLKISLPAGPMHMDGETAEGFVRFRATYREGDLKRIAVQQEFMKELFKQVLNKEKIIENAPEIFKTILSNVKTDFSLMEMPKYVGLLKDFSGESIETHMLPGVSQTINGASYFVMDDEKTREVASQIFFGAPKPTESPSSSQPPTISLAATQFSAENKAVSLEILNGGFTTGLATKMKDKIELDGFTVDAVGTFTGEKSRETRIFVLNQNNGAQFIKFFKNAQVVVDSNLQKDVVIVIGTDE